jgi:adenosylcobinamide kinase / adenosylcobinamide-phosphate guanylyltransferase
MAMVLVLGGARSGKSDLAVRLAVESGMPVTFIATATAGDEEMSLRIRRHREGRPADWTVIEAPRDLLDAIQRASKRDFVIVDCLTLWVSNLMDAGRSVDQISLLAAEVADELAARDGVVVSNEVGMGIVPGNELARSFRDALGSVNAVFARCADRALFMVAGLAVELRQPT